MVLIQLLFLFLLCLCDSLLCLVKGEVVSLVIVLDKLAPQCLLRESAGVVAYSALLLLCGISILDDSIADVVSHLVVVVVGTMDNLHTLVESDVSACLVVRPESESCKVGGDARHLEGYCLKRCVTPRLVI